MDLVVDTNCFISALIRSGKSRELICSLGLSLCAPEELLEEVCAHKAEIIRKSGITKADFDILVSILLSNIEIVPEEEFGDLKEVAKSLVKHPEDSPFMALAISKNIPIWSDDKALKEQPNVRVLSTTELINLLK